MEKNIFKNVCICVTESLSCTAEMNTTLCINYTSVKRMLKLKKKKASSYLVGIICYSGSGVYRARGKQDFLCMLLRFTRYNPGKGYEPRLND